MKSERTFIVADQKIVVTVETETAALTNAVLKAVELMLKKV